MPAGRRRRSAVRLLVAVAALAGTLLGALPARADPLDDYFATNDQLEQLLTERDALETSIATAASAERAALDRFGEVERTLGRLVPDHRTADARRLGLAQRVADAEAQVPALETQAALLEDQIRAQERWLNDSMAPQIFSARGFVDALATREHIPAERAAALQALGALRSEQAGVVLDLGRLNTEITFWERQADAMARQVGSLRARALSATARLGEVQKTALELTATAEGQLDALRRLGYPVGVGLVSDGLPPVPEPVPWPVDAPHGYALPTGASALALRAGEPLTDDRARSAVDALESATWTMPVKGEVTTPFGDATPYQPAHWAIDLGTRLYEPVRASADGIVEFAGLAVGDNRLASYGMIVLIRHGERLTSLYAHLDDRAYGAAVKPGDMVRQGQVIGYVGLTGNSTGPHLHFEARLDSQPFDPLLLVASG